MTEWFMLSLMAPQSGSGGFTVLLIQLAFIFAIFYFLLIRPQSQARKKHAQLLANLKKGDDVVTAGGLIGKVRDIKDNRITVESGSATVVVERNRIVQVGSEVSPTASS